MFVIKSYLVFLGIFSISTVMSYSTYHGRLFSLAQNPSNEKLDSEILTILNNKNPLTSAVNQPSHSSEYREKLQSRADWEVDDDNYYQWADQNRRPIENLIGKKREFFKRRISSAARRLNDGIWQSGLIG